MKKIYLSSIMLLCSYILFAQAIPNLVAHWPLNGNYNDIGPYGINGTNVGATSTTNRNSTANSAMQYLNPTSTINQYGTHPINANVNFSGTQNFTLDFWAFPNNPFVTNGGFYDNGINTGGPGVYFWNNGGYKIQFNYKNASVGTGIITLGTWIHVTCVRNNGTLSIYLNGVLNASGAEGTLAPTYPLPARFGSMYYTGFSPPQYNGLNGKLDEFRIYNRALTQAEINILVVTPIKLSTFTAAQKNNDILLNWQTATEINSKHFLVQRSTDGVNYNTIATINAKGQSADYANYSYTDKDATNLVSTGIIHYRLQMVDIDGKSQYSPVVKVATNKSTALVKVLQNPVKDNISLQLNVPQAENTAITLVNSMGQMVFNKNYSLQIGNNFITIPASTLPSTTYYLTVHYKNGKQTTTVIKD